MMAVVGCVGANPSFQAPDGASDQSPGQGSGDGATGRDLAGDPPIGLAIDLDPSVPRPRELLNGLLGYWSMDQAPGDKLARDSSGQGHHGVIESIDVSSAWIPGRHGTALRVPADDGAGVAVAPTAAIDGLRAYTIAAWIRRARAQPTGYNGIVSRQVDGTDGELYYLGLAKDQLRAYSPSRPEGATSGHAVSPRTIPLNAWVHAAATFDGTRLRLFEDGVLVDSNSVTWPLPTTTAPLYLGCNKNVSSTNQPLAADLDEVLLYGVALPQELISALAEGALPPLP